MGCCVLNGITRHARDPRYNTQSPVDTGVREVHQHPKHTGLLYNRDTSQQLAVPCLREIMH